MSESVEPEAVDVNGNPVTKSTDVGDVDMDATTMEGFRNSLGGYGGIDGNGLFICAEEMATEENTNTGA